MQWRSAGISVIVRCVAGLPLAAVLSVIGMAIASAMSVFFGVSALSTLLLLLMVGAGIGAGIGAGVTLLHVDSIPPWPVWLAIGIVLAAVSGLGAWVGLQVGETITAIEDANCVGVCGYLFKPRTYMALGATLVSNVVALAFNIGYEARFGLWPRLGLANTAADRPGQTESR